MHVTLLHQKTYIPEFSAVSVMGYCVTHSVGLLSSSPSTTICSMKLKHVNISMTINISFRERASYMIPMKSMMNYLPEVIVVQPHSSKVLNLLLLFLEFLLHVRDVNQPNRFIDMA